MLPLCLVPVPAIRDDYFEPTGNCGNFAFRFYSRAGFTETRASWELNRFLSSACALPHADTRRPDENMTFRIYVSINNSPEERGNALDVLGRDAWPMVCQCDFGTMEHPRSSREGASNSLTWRSSNNGTTWSFKRSTAVIGFLRSSSLVQAGSGLRALGLGARVRISPSIQSQSILPASRTSSCFKLMI